MGVTNLRRVLQLLVKPPPVAPLKKTIPSGNKLALDANWVMHRWTREEGIHLLEEEEQQVQEMSRLGVSISQKFMELGYIPVWVKDGFQKPLKEKLMAERRNQRTLAQQHAAEKKAQVATQVEEIQKKVEKVKPQVAKEVEKHLNVIQNQNASAAEVKKAVQVLEKVVPKKQLIQVKQLEETRQVMTNKLKKGFAIRTKHWKAFTANVANSGFTVVSAPADADSQIAYLSKQNVGFAVSDDFDVLAFGSPQLMNLSLTEKFAPASEILCRNWTRQYVLESLKAKPIDFISLCVLLGTDYTVPGLPTLPGSKLNDRELLELVEGVCGRLEVAKVSPRVRKLLESRTSGQYEIIMDYITNPLVYPLAYSQGAKVVLVRPREAENRNNPETSRPKVSF